MKSDPRQTALRLAFGVHHAPADAPRKLVLACLQYDEYALNKALSVAMKSGSHKAAFVAAFIGKHESYVSLMRRGKRPVPDKLIDALCVATGTNLLRQVARAVDAMTDDDEARLVSMMQVAA